VADADKRYFPAFLDLERRLAVVVGEGPNLEKRVRQLLRYAADVVVVTASPTEWLLQSESDGNLTLEQRSYVRGDLEGAFIALCVTSDKELRSAVFAEAESIGCLVNVADSPELCSFLLPSVLNRGSLQIAISTGGAAPALAKRLRRRFDAELGPEWGAWVALLGEVRALVMERIEDGDERARVLDAVAADEVRERLAAGEELSAEALFEQLAPTTEGETE
jgi:precorrin-2 dehydrogenase/sirohydrochlorin ferrochelatase